MGVVRFFTHDLYIIIIIMPFLNKGVWTLDDSKKPAGFLASAFNNWITKDGKAGRTGERGFKAESGRYHLYIGKGCPFANRVTIMMQLKDLFEHVSVTYTAPQMYQDNRWGFVSEEGYKDDLYGKDHLYEVYNHVEPGCTCVVSVPFLVDKKLNKAVSNDSGDIMEMFNSAFDEITGNTENYLKPKFTWKAGLEEDGETKDFNNICVGVYKMPMAPDDGLYYKAFHAFFNSCDELDEILGKRKFLNGDELSICDLKIFSTLVRFDFAYYFLYHANFKRMKDYENISRWLENVYMYKGIYKTVDFEHIKKLYYGNRAQNPSGRVPLGPEIWIGPSWTRN